MKTGAASGCLIWLVTFGVIGACLCNLAAVIGGITATTHRRDVAHLFGQWLCPAGTTADVYEYSTIMQDETGDYIPATGYEVHCRDTAGETVRNLGGSYALAWVGLLIVIATTVAALLALVLAAPAGALIGRFIRRRSSAA